MVYKKFFKIDGIFYVGGRKLVNVWNGTDAVNLRLPIAVERYFTDKLYKIVKVVNLRVDDAISTLYKFHRNEARSSVLFDNTAEVSSLIRRLHNSSTRSSVEEDNRAVFQPKL